MLEREIKEFADYLMDNAAKWNNKEWVQGQYDNHIEECAELREKKDIHLQAELLDKAIISAVGEKLGITVFLDDVAELTQDIVDNGVVEYDDVPDLLQKRKDKFISKIHL